MNLQAKKTIAREFILLILMTLIGIAFFLCTFLYNFYTENQVNQKDQEIKSKTLIADSLSNVFDKHKKKQSWIYDKLIEEFNVDNNYTQEKAWNQLLKVAKSNNTRIKWTTTWVSDLTPFLKKIGFNTPESFQSFILKYEISSDVTRNKQLAIELKRETSTLNKEKIILQEKILNIDKQINLGIGAFVICFVIIFFMRYIYYGIRWSVKTLKQEPV
ncbi:hypothetical protein [Pedobacter sp. JCM 36344]|uniref:hypothetical protein n=1 Tax=Pedobacter sp. JCM 36344 TaxID=3374280 RepID=UPI00397D7FAB